MSISQRVRFDTYTVSLSGAAMFDVRIEEDTKGLNRKAMLRKRFALPDGPACFMIQNISCVISRQTFRHAHLLVEKAFREMLGTGLHKLTGV